MTNTKVMSGFMELTPDMQAEFDRIKRIIEESYCSFGFTPIDMPVLERSEIFLAKADGKIVDSRGAARLLDRVSAVFA